ncbi:MAG: bifunctional 2',3'-cyclic-nucleotide 2'-phosphodiesterase/3'-nucleotidase [Pseudomonadota bacterium]
MNPNRRAPRRDHPQYSCAKVRILATTDLHMNLNGFDYYADTPDPTLGLSRTATLIRKARSDAGHDLVLLFDNGDSLQGTPVGDWAARTEGPHPMMLAFKALQYDAIALGNHDFGLGFATLDRVLAQAPGPVLCGNLKRLEGVAKWQSKAVLDRIVPIDGRKVPIRIGVLSVLPPQTIRWESHVLQGNAVAQDILSAARNGVRALKRRNCDVIVALAHSGIGPRVAAENMENAIIPLSEIDGIDAIIAGHTHLTFPGDAHSGLAGVDIDLGRISGKPVVMPGSAGSHLGVIDLDMRWSTRNGWQIDDHRSQLRSIRATCTEGSVSEDPEMRDLFEVAHAATRTMLARPVGRVTQHLHSYFSCCAADRGLALVAAAQASAVRPFLNTPELAKLPLLSAVSPHKFGGRSGPRCFTDVPAGEIERRHVDDLHVFPNDLRALVVKGSQVRDWLEMSAGVFNRMGLKADTDLVDPRRAGHNFDVVFGLRYRIDLSRPARFNADGGLIDAAHSRIVDLTHDRRPIEDEQMFVVATNTYRAIGGGHFPFVGQVTSLPLPNLAIKSIIRDFVSNTAPDDYAQTPQHPFAFVPQPGAFAILKTGPGARAHLADISRYRPQLLGCDPDGFERIRLAL